jgi:hypothetical protein
MILSGDTAIRSITADGTTNPGVLTNFLLDFPS